MWRGTLRIRSRTARLAMPCSRSRWTRRSRVRAEVMPMPVSRRSVIDAFQPAADGGQCAVAREIDLERRHRYEALGDRVEVRAGPCVLLGPRWPDPEHRT